MKKNILFSAIICLALAFTACQEKGDIQPPPEILVLDTVLTYDVNLVYNDSYTPVVQKIDSAAICKLFGITYSAFKSSIATEEINTGKVKYYAVLSDNSIDDAEPTANGNGHWFDAAGGVCEWGTPGSLYSEYQIEGWAFSIGSRPDNTSVGQNITIRQAFLYAPDDLTLCRAINIFNVSLVASK